MADLDAIGVIELVGLAAAIECADAAVKAANVKLIGYELSRGKGMVTIKVSGKVAAVQAAVAAGKTAASKVGKVVGKLVIPRPHDDLEKLIFSEDTVSTVEVKEKGKGNGSEEVARESVDEVSKGIEDLAESDILESDILEDDISEDDKPSKGDLEKNEPENETEEIKKTATCNICGDPKCPRQKGEPRINCIHYKKDEKK